MPRGIRHQDVNLAVRDLTGTASVPVLPGEIDGLQTVCHVIAPGATLTIEPVQMQGRVYLFVEGSGSLDSGGERYEVTEMVFYAPRHDAALTMHSNLTGDTSLRCLELIVDQSPTDLQELQDAGDRYPLFLSYSDCKTYRERIKSEKTVSRTLLPEHTFPRLCIGSVETTGDDRVAAHEHPMLEQLFFGLRDNDCIVTADETSLAFGEGILLHIPLGSSHGVEVHEPRRLHYIWIDLFRDRRGMDWITQEHIPNP